jgi:hypothetical protein
MSPPQPEMGYIKDIRIDHLETEIQKLKQENRQLEDAYQFRAERFLEFKIQVEKLSVKKEGREWKATLEELERFLEGG